MQRRHSELWVYRWACPADRRKRVAPATSISVKPWAQAVSLFTIYVARYRMYLAELSSDEREQIHLIRSQARYRPTRSGRTTANSRIDRRRLSLKIHPDQSQT
jgi:hypothetical protein